MRSHSLLDHPEAEAFQRGLGENHLSELEFLLAQRLRYLHDPEVPWSRLGQLEARALAHAEALHAASKTGLAQTRALLTEDDANRVRASAYTLTLHGTEDMDEVFQAMDKAPEELLPAWFEALALVSHTEVAPGLCRLLSSSRSQVRASAAHWLGWRREGEAECLLPLLEDPQPVVRSATALALARLRYQHALKTIETQSRRVPPGEAVDLLPAALLMGSSDALQQVRRLCVADNPPPALLHLLALAGDECDVARIQRCVVNPGLAISALHAMGVLGVPATVPMLLEQLEAAETKTRLAADEALSLMTGARLPHQLHLHRELDEGENRSTWVETPVTEPKAWRRWWEDNRARFGQAPRWRRGQPFSVVACLAELKEPLSPLRVRTRAARELALHTRQSIDFEPDWPVLRQQQALNHWQKMFE
ncbi:hypothetical protein CYFUS_003809 [Cystobacter fuscus]|uniref:TIGR02270 family protein n=1 Tax=Cystobacter fuscus TaxID=43 RepID=A0A250J328_9BACT|nr:HEAT repeat domain-containing protein [Cystobacter fuscus]ATB38375.1 hypothetical protein CYFUS_003809 [Cystobacter fuscus]